MDQTIWAANQRKFRKCGRPRVKIKFESNEVDEDITIVRETLEPPLIIDWNASKLLRSDIEYPKCLKVSNVSTDIQTLDLGDGKIPSDPMSVEVESVKEKLLEQFKDVFSDGEDTLKIMNCKPSVIELMPDAKPIRLSTARNIAFGYREETKKELDKMVSQGIIKPVGDKATDWCSPMIVVRSGYIITCKHLYNRDLLCLFTFLSFSR